MPTYEYRCSDCKHAVEVVQSFSDAPLTTCERCGGELKRVFHPVGIVLKGSGFYSTDNRSGKALSPGKGEAKTESKKDTKAEKKSDKAPSKDKGPSSASAAS